MSTIDTSHGVARPGISLVLRAGGQPHKLATRSVLLGCFPAMIMLAHVVSFHNMPANVAAPSYLGPLAVSAIMVYALGLGWRAPAVLDALLLAEVSRKSGCALALGSLLVSQAVTTLVAVWWPFDAAGPPQIFHWLLFITTAIVCLSWQTYTRSWGMALGVSAILIWLTTFAVPQEGVLPGVVCLVAHMTVLPAMLFVMVRRFVTTDHSLGGLEALFCQSLLN